MPPRIHASLRIALVLLMQSQALAQTPQAVQATRAFQAGSSAFAQGNLEQARQQFSRAVQLAPRVAAAHVALGTVLEELGRLPEAERELQVGVKLAPADPVGLLNLCLVEARLNKNAEAVATFGHLQAVDANVTGMEAPEAAIPLATALVATAHADQAIELLQRAFAANPASAVLADTLGTVLAGQRRFDAAERTLQQALTLDPGLALAQYHLGAVYVALGRPAEALPPLERAHMLDPANAAFTVQLSQALLLAGQEEEALSLLRAALPAAGVQTTEVRYRLALALQSTGRIQDALPLFAQVLADRPNDADALTNAALAQVQNGDAVAGIALYQRALKAAPPTATLREDLGVAYLQQGDQNDALEQFRQGLKLEPGNPQLHYDLGLALKLKDDLAGAIPEFQKAGELDPTLPDPPYTLGILYMQQGRFAESADNLQRALALRPQNGDAWATLGSVYRQLDQSDKAEPALRKAIALLPDQPSPHITLAALLAAQGKREEAAAERKRGSELTKIAVNRQKAQFLVDSGLLLLKRGQTAEAEAQLREAVEADPGYPASHTALAEVLDRAGRKAEAAQERQKAAAAPGKP